MFVFAAGDGSGKIGAFDKDENTLRFTGFTLEGIVITDGSNDTMIWCRAGDWLLILNVMPPI